MITVPQVTEHVQVVKEALPTFLQYMLTQRADELARETKFVQRTSPITGAAFVQTLIFSFLGCPDATYTTLNQHLAMQQIAVSPQALEQRMTMQGAAFLRAFLQELARTVLQNPDPVAVELYERFAGVYLQDGTVIGLPDVLKEVWRGFGGSPGASGSAIQVQVRLNMSTGELAGPWLADGCACERSGDSSLQQNPLPAQALRITDVGYLTADLIKQASQPDQPFFLCGSNATWVVRTQQDGPSVDLPTFLEGLSTGSFDGWVWLTGKRAPVRLIACRLPEAEAARRQARVGANTARRGKGSKQVQVGKKQGLPCVYVSKRCKPGAKTRRTLGWSVLLTNVPATLLSGHEARVLLRARWQIELLWKLWKQIGELDTWRSAKAERILCEVYAKLIGLLIQHWLIQIGCWSNPHRSMVKASEAVRLVAPCILLALQGSWDLAALFALLPLLLEKCSINKKRKRPGTSQKLEEAIYQ